MSLTVIGDGLGQDAGMRSIRQSVQNGHFLCRLAQNALDLLVASRADKRIERLLVHVVATGLARGRPPSPRGKAMHTAANSS